MTNGAVLAEKRVLPRFFEETRLVATNIPSRVKFAVFRLAFMAGIAIFAHYLNNKDFSIL